MYAITDGGPEHIADWAEWYVTHSQGILSKTMLSSQLALTLNLEDDDADMLVESVWLELRYRAQLYGPDTPIRIVGRVLESRFPWLDNPHYLACLIFSLTGNGTRATYAGQLFEEVSAIAIKQYIGGESIIFGFPSTLKVSDLATSTLERYIREFPGKRKDRNLDIISWRPFGDARPGQLVILVQCAAGRNWKTKTKELVTAAWEKLIQFHVSPVRGFTLPYIISSNIDFEEHSTDAGIILDRVRIYRCTYGVALEADLKRRLTIWCKGRLTAMNKN
jgi:hypothetical protein